MSHDSRILEYISEFYLSSGDFNGVPIHVFLKQFDLGLSATTVLIQKLLQGGQIELEFGNVHPNPHIKAFSHITQEQQLEFLKDLGLSYAVCVYPSKEYLATLPLEAAYSGEHEH